MIKAHSKALGSIFFALSSLLLCSSDVEASTVHALSCNVADVGNAVNSAQPGDTVVIPAGTCTWSSQLRVTKGITLAGQGIGQTVILDNVPKSSSGSNRVMVFDVKAPERFRLTALTIQGMATDPGRMNQGHVGLHGNSKSFRVDNIKFVNLQTVGIRADGDLWGVIDHCVFSGNFQQGVFVSHSTWGGRTYGDGSWAESTYLGTEKAIYIEDNTFIEESALYAAGSLDGLDGARVVFRRNQLVGTFVASHGTESGQRRRSMRSFEIYENAISLPAGKQLDRVFYIRGGTGVIWGNTISSAWNTLVSMQNFRDTASYFPWGKCDGTSPYDQNTQPGGRRCIDQPGAGTSSLLSGDTPAPGWAGNISDPIYIWGNSGGAFSFAPVGGSKNVIKDQDFFEVAKPGYIPFTYPHPLVSGPNAPARPTNLRVVPGG